MEKRIIVLMAATILGMAVLVGCNKSQSSAASATGSGIGTAPQKLDRAAQRIGVDYFNQVRVSMEKVITERKQGV
ncbi:hypothetical protein AGMMS50293_03600 [Spirochaetia bacterium]|nr:hypothetical protein AGMMS50293_03600 [Spirochaetia bacterium]